MKPGGGKGKGGNFEREQCRVLTEWVTGNRVPEIFWRSAASGAKATQGRKKGEHSHMAGDLVAVDEQGYWFADRFSVEFKFRKSYGELEQIFVGRNPIVMDWWKQTVRDAEAEDKIPLLVFKENQSPVYLGIPLPDACGVPCAGISRIDVRWFESRAMCMYNWQDWLNSMPALILKRMVL